MCRALEPADPRAPLRRTGALSRAVALAVLLPWAPLQIAHADGHGELAADALLAGRPSEGLLVLHSGYRNSSWIDADALVWTGAAADGSDADVLVVSVRLRDPNGLGEARFGRFIMSTGAIRPVQIDGVSTLCRMPSGTQLELFGGMPVVPELGPRAFDWLGGARLGQWLLGQRLGAGVSYLHRRDAGALADEELGADLSASPLPWASVNAIAAFDLVYDGLSEARISALAHGERDRLELFAARREAARLLPATSLFSVIGGAPSSELGTNASWNAYPRLDLGGTLALEALDDELGYRAALRGTLRFSDEATSELRVEASRRELRDDGWSGVLVGGEWPFARALRVHASVELVAADHPGPRGALWPWTRAGFGYQIGAHWLFSGALGLRASPELSHELQAFVRLGYRTELWP